MISTNCIFLRHIALFILLATPYVHACPCFNENYVYTAFHQQMNVQCIHSIHRDSIGSNATKTTTYSIYSGIDHATAILVEGGNTTTGSYANTGSCNMHLMHRQNGFNLSNVAEQFPSCMSAIQNACARLGVQIKTKRSQD